MKGLNREDKLRCDTHNSHTHTLTRPKKINSEKKPKKMRNDVFADAIDRKIRI